MEKNDKVTPTRQRGRLQIPIFILIISAIVFLLVTIFVGRGSVISLTLLDSFNLAGDAFAFCICFCIFIIEFIASGYTRVAQTKFIGSTFFAIAFLHLGHAISGFVGSNTDNLTAFIWIVARYLLIAALLFASFLPLDRPSRWIKSRLRILTVTLIIAVLVIFPAYLLNQIPSLMLPDGVITDTMTMLEYSIIIFFAIGAFRYWQLVRQTKNNDFLYIMSALIIAGFGELLITLYNTIIDLTAFIGYIFVLLSFLLIFQWLVSSSIRRPYQALLLSMAKIEQGKDRAETYLDFLCHDTANILAPVRSYAEVIANGTQGNIKEVREYAAKIVSEADRASSLTRFLRKMSAAEKELSTAEPTVIDLGKTLHDVMDNVRRLYPYVKLDFTLDMPQNVPIYSIGKGHVGEIMEEVLCLAGKFSKDNSASIGAIINEKTPKGGGKYWQVQLSLRNLNIPKEVDLTISEVFDSANRMKRGVVSDMSIYATIIHLLGGRMWSEGWERGKPSTELSVFLELPKVQPSQ